MAPTEYRFKDTVLPVIDPSMSHDEHRKAYASKHGELTTAVVEDKGEVNGKHVVEFKVSTGTKG